MKITAEKVAFVVARTGCTEAQAISELEAEEGCEDDAIRNLRAFLAEGGAKHGQ